MSGPMTGLEGILKRNRAWADRMSRDRPGFFQDLSRQQTPDYLWIGCSDSRVPATQIMDLPPGAVFVHRNIANVVSPSDLNCLSVMQYAIDVLRVRHVIVCGHYGCGGVQAAMSDEDRGLIDNWLNHIRDVKRRHADRFAADTTSETAVNLLCELNILEQVAHACGTAIVRNAWEAGRDLTVHGVVYSLRDGLLTPLTARTGPPAD